MFAAWKDVDLTAGTFTVKAKPAMGFKPKDSEERTIPIPSSLVRDLKADQGVETRSADARCGAFGVARAFYLVPAASLPLITDFAQ
jgi:integrase